MDQTGLNLNLDIPFKIKHHARILKGPPPPPVELVRSLFIILGCSAEFLSADNKSLKAEKSAQTLLQLFCC